MSVPRGTVVFWRSGVPVPEGWSLLAGVDFTGEPVADTLGESVATGGNLGDSEGATYEGTSFVPIIRL